MVKIKVMIAVEVEVNVTQHGELVFAEHLTPVTYETIRNSLEVIPEAFADEYCPLACVGNYAIIQR